MFPDYFSVSFEYVESKHQAVGTRPDLYPNEVVVFAGNGSVISLMCMFRKDLEIFCPTKCCLIPYFGVSTAIMLSKRNFL